MAEESGRVEDTWQRREEEERMRGKEGRKSRGYVAEEEGRVDDTWRRRRG